MYQAIQLIIRFLLYTAREALISWSSRKSNMLDDDFSKYEIELHSLRTITSFFKAMEVSYKKWTTETKPKNYFISFLRFLTRVQYQHHRIFFWPLFSYFLVLLLQHFTLYIKWGVPGRGICLLSSELVEYLQYFLELEHSSRCLALACTRDIYYHVIRLAFPSLLLKRKDF